MLNHVPLNVKKKVSIWGVLRCQHYEGQSKSSRNCGIAQ